MQKQQYLFPDTRLYGGLISQKWSIIALQVPVLAMVPMTSEARTELIKAGIGIFIDTPQQGVTVIKQVFSEKFPMTANKEYCRRYLASQQTKSFIDIFQKIQ